MKIAIIGCGFIGTEIAKLLDKKDNVVISGVSDINEENARNLIAKLNRNTPIIRPISENIAHADFIIESASPEIVPYILNLAKGKKVFIMSVGGLLGHKLPDNVFFPSGAIGGLDAIRAASSGKIESITLTTTKHPRALKGAPFVEKNNVDLDVIDKKVIFSGSVHDAISGFPTNINVAASVAITSKAPEKLKVKIIADPNIKTNTHEIEIISDSGKFSFRFQNVPSDINPKTSKLAVYSALSAIEMLIRQQ